MKTYSIIRFIHRGEPRVIATGKTLEEVQEHCRDRDTSSRTCTSREGVEFTNKFGPWFDGYTEEE